MQRIEEVKPQVQMRLAVNPQIKLHIAEENPQAKISMAHKSEDRQEAMLSDNAIVMRSPLRRQPAASNAQLVRDIRKQEPEERSLQLELLQQKIESEMLSMRSKIDQRKEELQNKEK